MLNVIKSPSPASVNWEDQLQRDIIKKDFFEICYVCERHEPIDYEIDHFVSQKIPNKKNDWDNLYYICQKCNKIKPKKTNEDPLNEILDCCKDDVEKIVELFYDDLIGVVQIQMKLSQISLKVKADNTMYFLNKVYNGIDTDSSFYIDLRKQILKLLALFIKDSEDYKKSLLKRGKLAIIREHVRKDTYSEKSAFISFKKSWLFKNNQNLYKEIFP